MVTSDDNDCLKRVNDFFSVLNQKLKVHRQTKRHLDRFLSTDFNVFTFIKPDEKRLSNVIANLLNPASSHGQQHVFLDTFLRRIGKDDLCDAQPPQVTCEDHFETPESRGLIDISVKFKDFKIAIENKPWPWSKEGNEQIGKYSDYLNKEYKDQFCLIYLTFSGDEPVSIDHDKRERLMEAGNLLCISYHSNILEWLRECSQLCESDIFRGFLRDFMNYIPTMEEQMSNSSEEKKIGERMMILEHALEKENLETALDIGFAFDDLRERIIVGFLSKLEKSVLGILRQRRDGSEWHVSGNFRCSPLESYASFSFGKKTWGNQYGVALQSHAANACEVIIGVERWYDDKTNKGARRFQPKDHLRKKLNHKIRNGVANDNRYWEWRHHLDDPYRNWNGKETLIKLHNGEAVKVIGLYLVKIIKVAAPIIDRHVQGSSKNKTARQDRTATKTLDSRSGRE